MASNPKDSLNQDILTFRPDIEFERKPIKGDGDTLAEDPSQAADIRQKSAERVNARRHRRLKRLKTIEQTMDALEERILDNLQDFSITFDPTVRPMLAEAVDTLMRSNGPVPSSDAADAAAAAQAPVPPPVQDEEIIRTLEEQDVETPTPVDLTDVPSAPTAEITIECYQRATTLLMDSMYHAFGIDPVAFGLANTGNGPPMLVPPPTAKPANCAEMASMANVDTSATADLMPADAIVEQKQRNTLLDLFRILWKLILYFIYGFIIEFMKKLKLHKIPFGVGKKVKKLIKKLGKKRKKILCKITGDCADVVNDDDPYIPDPNDGFEAMDTIGDETWTGIDCLSAAKTVVDFVATQLAFHPAVETPSATPATEGPGSESGAPATKDERYGKVNGKAHLLPTLNAVMQARDRFEAMKFAVVLEIPSSEPEFDTEIAEIEESSKKRPRYGNRFHSRTAQGWKDMR